MLLSMKMAEKKLAAITLRREGKSYGEITQVLGVPKSTLSYWLKGIPLSPQLKERHYTARVRNLNKGAQSNRARREREITAIIEGAASEISSTLSREAYMLFGAALYWAEGTKRGMLEFTNSDPLMIYFFVRWLEEVLAISPSTLKAKLNMYAQQDEQELKRFWSDLCGIPPEHFGKSYIKPPSKNVKGNTLYYGTIKVVVPKSMDAKLRIFGWIEGVMRKYQEDVRHIERKWTKLKNVARPVNLS